MTLQERFVTVEEFEAFIKRPENADKRFEHIGGEIYEVPTNQIASQVTARLLLLIGMYLLKHDIGHLTGPDHGYVVAGERYAPDVGFISYEKMPHSTKAWFTPLPPELAVKVVSSDRADENKKLSVKVTNFLSTGAVVWVVRPQERHIEVHAPGAPVAIYRDDDTLDGGQLLPELSIKVSDIFSVIKD
jgi:Uma2 family endonuclease